MTVDQIVNRICRKVGRLDDNSRHLCEDFVAERFNMIWDRRLWEESKIWATTTVVAGQREVGFPESVLSVLAVRVGKRTLDPVQPETLLRIDPEAFTSTGTPARFIQAGRREPGDEKGEDRVIQLMEAPKEESDLLYCAKTKPPTLAGDDTPPLTGCVTALLAYVEADMLENARQYAKARLKIEEAEAQMQMMIDNEERQQARQQRIIPDAPTDWGRDDIY